MVSYIDMPQVLPLYALSWLIFTYLLFISLFLVQSAPAGVQVATYLLPTNVCAQTTNYNRYLPVRTYTRVLTNLYLLCYLAVQARGKVCKTIRSTRQGR